MAEIPSVDAIATICSMSDPAKRNHHITQTYHQLTVELAKIFGTKDVTWCAYATWASKTAGTFIRGEEVPHLVRSYLDSARHVSSAVSNLNAELSKVHSAANVHEGELQRIIEEVIGAVTDNVGQGNLIVFQELAPPYARMLSAFANQTIYDQSVIDRFVSQFKPGPVEQGGQSLLIEAFTHYYRALHECDARRKAEFMFLGNALAGYHEQIRLQGPIAGSLNAPLEAPFMQLVHEEAKSGVPEQHHGVIAHLVERIIRPLGTRIEQEWDEISTRWLMTLQLPDAKLDLGKDVPKLANGQSFPESLQTVEYPPLVELLGHLDRTPNSLSGSAAKDWASLSDRMNYVVDFFRSRQQDPNLYQDPREPV
jgi:hypothetical protein